jgi:hypothetical protein
MLGVLLIPEQESEGAKEIQPSDKPPPSPKPLWHQARLHSQFPTSYADMQTFQNWVLAFSQTEMKYQAYPSSSFFRCSVYISGMSTGHVAFFLGPLVPILNNHPMNARDKVYCICRTTERSLW